MPSRIEDYAIIADCRSLALVAKDGSIDWLCLPRFDSDALFAALLGTPDNGRWLLAPAGGVKRVRRRYRDGMLILETEFETEEGSATVRDLMPIYGEGTDLLRIVVGNRGRVPMRMELVIRFGYGSVVPWVQRIDGGIRAVAGPDCLGLHTPVGRTARTSRRWRTSLASTPRSPCRARPGAAMLRDGFVARYRTRSGVDGLPPGEGVFLPCSFWLAENYVLQGRIEEARSLFERLCGLANDVGLLSEEYDPAGQSASHDRFQRSGSPPTR